MPERKMGRLSARVLEATPKRPLSINGLEVLPMKSWEGLQVAPQRPSTEGLQVVIDSSLETAYDASPEVMYEKAAENPPGKKRLLTSKFRGIGLLWIVIAAFILVTSVVVLGVIVAKKNSHNNSSQATHTSQIPFTTTPNVSSSPSTSFSAKSSGGISTSIFPATKSSSSAVSTSTGAIGSSLPSSISAAKVTNTTAFVSGAGNIDNANENDGIGAGSDIYNCYSGAASAFPDSSKWVSFSDMWTANIPLILQGCPSGMTGPNTTVQQLGFMKSALQNVSQVSLVDHRFILAIILEESSGCVTVDGSDSYGASSAGLMLVAGGSGFIGDSADATDQAVSIQQMIAEGTQGAPTTLSGADGLVQDINKAGNVYDAAFLYSINFEADIPSTLDSYSIDIANRLTGWVTAPQVTCT